MTNNFNEYTFPVTPKYTELQKRVYLLGRTSKDFRRCHAIKENGTACGCQANTFEVFCRSHMAQGYGLFTLAVVAQVETVSK